MNFMIGRIMPEWVIWRNKCTSIGLAAEEEKERKEIVCGTGDDGKHIPCHVGYVGPSQ
jgi:dihydroxyacetone kinase